MKQVHVLSVLWAATCVAVLATDLDVVIFLLVAPYILFGAGLAFGAAVPNWPELSDSTVPRSLLGGIGAFAASFAASALGGQPLVWASEWTPTRHIIATCVVSTVMFWVAARVFDSPLTSAAPVVDAHAEGAHTEVEDTEDADADEADGDIDDDTETDVDTEGEIIGAYKAFDAAVEASLGGTADADDGDEGAAS